MKKIGRNAGKNAGGLAQLVTRFGNEITQVVPVSYTHLTLPTICSV